MSKYCPTFEEHVDAVETAIENVGSHDLSGFPGASDIEDSVKRLEAEAKALQGLAKDYQGWLDEQPQPVNEAAVHY